ncbi:SDR family NAD(P)-dependent oxidoreductase [Actinomadura algeriensis]|uniref:NAD(P)-dependent dehydrogenase (Short-subunit alcohol dehydrogenase family) n=1 Tax=Actinomadura algeriensis TaxID=1679523 RepID=A0ABR9JL26_9ACTN|nr:SDR family oxidoreductase [Actinomadura algeriensis]MBE1530820.1 NAD(P)-dependent dehydrogenase (short-subunit alcohol dehydrogenase family) [Actinomadura algeriensis]
MNRYDGVKVLLTGAASGIGRATAIRLASEGAAVYGVDLSEAGLAETAAAITGPGTIATRVADVADEPAVIAAVRDAAETLGGIDVLVNVAGVHRTTPLASLTVDDLMRLFRVNVVGTALFCREAAGHLPDGTGAIVNVASLSAVQGNPYMSAYSASKGAVISFSLSLAAELSPRRIRVLSISPGSVDTPLTRAPDMFPDGVDASYFGRLYAPFGVGAADQIAAVIAYAGSSDAAYQTGVDLRVDGGSHM